MGILRLGKPNSKIAEEIRRRREQPEKKLKMTGTNGTVCEFSYSDTTSALVFDDRKAASVLYPYSLCSDIDSPDKLVSVCDEGNRITAIGDGSGAGLYNCGKLSSVCCPKLKIIRNTAMRKLSLVKSYDFPELETIENSGISYNRFLSSLNAPNIRYIADGALADNEMLSVFSVSPANPNFSLVDEFNNVGKSGIVLIDENLHNAVWGSIPMCKDILLPNDVSGIGSQSFMNCKKLEKIECDRVTLIGDKAFYGCTSLSTVVLSNMSNDDPTQLGGTNAFGVKRAWPVSVYVPLSCIDDLLLNETWSGLEELNTIRLIGVGKASERLKMISVNGESCEFSYSSISQPLAYTSYSRTTNKPFNLCAEISTYNTVQAVVDGETQITSIGNQGFYFCDKLSSIDCKNATTIGENAFQRTSLVECDFPNVKTIKQMAFLHCENLSAANIPKTETIGVNAFYFDTKLQTINCQNAIELCSNAFHVTDSLSTVILSCMSNNNLTRLGNTTVFGDKRDWPVSVYVPLSCIDCLMDPALAWAGLVELGTIKLVGV